ncbi:MAG: hypothetical protein ACK4QL_08350 [Pseudanabaenaceae cyanobacterium]
MKEQRRAINPLITENPSLKS